MADKPLFHASGVAVFQRSITEPDEDNPGCFKMSMGFRVCDVCPGVDPEDVAKLLNRGELFERLRSALTGLVKRCDGAEGMRADGSNIDTCEANYLLAELEAM